LRWQAAHGIGDSAVRQFEPVICRRAERLIGKAVIEQGLIQQDAGEISRERATGGIGPVHARRQPDDQQTGRRVAERWHRPGVIFRVSVLHLVAKFSQSLTLAAIGAKSFSDCQWFLRHNPTMDQTPAPAASRFAMRKATSIACS